jgi:ABC-type antimicrobial peptide transport system permease subunit
VTESLAERHWPGESAVGRDLAVGEDRWSIVGVVGDVRTFRSGENVEPAIYVPQAQAPTRRGYMLVGRAASLSSMREELWSAAPDVALGPPATLREMIDGVYAGQRVLAVLVGAYAAAALLITLISLYAVVGHLVVRHHREYGVRVALGASPSHVVRRATWRGLRAATLGGLTGVVLAAALAQLMASFLVDLRVGEPLVFVGLPLAVLLLAALAAYLPARKAARQEPAAILGV